MQLALGFSVLNEIEEINKSVSGALIRSYSTTHSNETREFFLLVYANYACSCQPITGKFEVLKHLVSVEGYNTVNSNLEMLIFKALP